MGGDWEHFKREAGRLLSEGEREVRRQTQRGELRLRRYKLARQRDEELRRLGERVWDLHRRGGLDEDALIGVFEALDALSVELAAIDAQLAGDDDGSGGGS